MKTVPLNPVGLPPLPGVASHGIAVPDIGLVYTTGQVAWGPDGALDAPADLGAQFARAYANIDLVLAEAGSSREKIIKETIYLVGWTTDRAQELVQLLADARQGRPIPPASTAVGVETLYAEGFLVEIETVALL